MNQSILNIEVQDFINNSLNSGLTTIILKGSPFNDVDTRELTTQIEAKKKCEKKLPTWFGASNIYYPNKLNIEQTSSEVTAKYKSEIIKGNSIIDLTGGFGVDCYYFSKQFKDVYYCEINSELFEIVKHNFKHLNANTVKTVNCNGIEFLNVHKKQFDWIYIDPSRRHDSKGKVFFLKDCTPNVVKHLDLLFEYSDKILIKTSPLLDITIGINELKFVKQIQVVAVENDVKELLWVLEKGYNNFISINTVNITKAGTEHFNYQLQDETTAQAAYTIPLTYLYEPNAAILKSGAFKSVSERFKVYKLHVNSHLYTSNQLIEFPGRAFKILKTLPYNKKVLKAEGFVKANITTRNFPDSVDQIRKKLSIKDGGNVFLFFTTNCNNEKTVLVCEKIKVL